MTTVCTTATLSMHSRNVWLILDATSKVLKLGHGNNPALGQAFFRVDEAFTKHRQWRQTQDTSAYQTWAEASSYECNRASNSG